MRTTSRSASGTHGGGAGSHSRPPTRPRRRAPPAAAPRAHHAAAVAGQQGLPHWHAHRAISTHERQADIFGDTVFDISSRFVDMPMRGRGTGRLHEQEYAGPELGGCNCSLRLDAPQPVVAAGAAGVEHGGRSQGYARQGAAARLQQHCFRQPADAQQLQPRPRVRAETDLEAHAGQQDLNDKKISQKPPKPSPSPAATAQGAVLACSLRAGPEPPNRHPQHGLSGRYRKGPADASPGANLPKCFHLAIGFARGTHFRSRSLLSCLKGRRSQVAGICQDRSRLAGAGHRLGARQLRGGCNSWSELLNDAWGRPPCPIVTGPCTAPVDHLASLACGAVQSASSLAPISLQ